MLPLWLLPKSFIIHRHRCWWNRNLTIMDHGAAMDKNQLLFPVSIYERLIWKFILDLDWLTIYVFEIHDYFNDLCCTKYGGMRMKMTYRINFTDDSSKFDAMICGSMHVREKDLRNNRTMWGYSIAIISRNIFQKRTFLGIMFN